MTCANHSISVDWAKTQEDGVYKHYRTCLNGCGTQFEEGECAGSASTCLTPSYCDVCGQKLTEIDKGNHESEETYYMLIDEASHSLYYSCCDADIEQGQGAHTPMNDPTCTGQSICSVCHGGYGEINSENHSGSLVYEMENTYHYQQWDCCKVQVGAKERHTPIFSVSEDGQTLSAVCSVCGYNLGSSTLEFADDGITYDGQKHKAVQNGYIYCASGDYSLYITYWQNDSMLNISNNIGISNAGTYTVRLGNADHSVYIEKEITINKRELTLDKVCVWDKAYDGTNTVTAYSAEFGNVVEGEELFCGVSGDVVVSGSTVGLYETVTGITAINVFAFTIASYYGDNYYVTVDPDTAYTIADGGCYINAYTLDITAQDQSITEGGELDQTLYTIYDIPAGCECTGITLVKDEANNTISVNTDNAVITLDGNDVTSNFEFRTYSGILEVSCEGHTFNEYGFCSTGSCNAYEIPEYIADEFDDKTYYISNAGQLYWFAQQVNEYHNNAIGGVLVNDIEVPDSYTTPDGSTVNVPDWVPIGGSTFRYCGGFDGDGYVISGLYCKTESDYVGLFGYTDYNYPIKNIGLSDCYFEGSNYVGALAGTAYSVIDHCYAVNCTVTSSNSYVGGLVGFNGGEINNSCAHSENIAGYSYGSITNCYYLSTEDDSIDGTTGMTNEQFASGEVAYLLNNTADEAGEESVQNWYQNLDNGETPDEVPVLDGSHGVVYQVLGCGGEGTAYSNTDAKKAHSKYTYTADEEDGSLLHIACGVCSDDLGTLQITAPGSLTYDGVKKTANIVSDIDDITIPEIEYTSETQTMDSAPVNAGTYTASITMGEVTASIVFTINPMNISDAEIVLENALFVYNGEQQTAEIASVTVNGLPLTADDYEITGKGNFTGETTAEWTIAKATASVSTEPTANLLEYNGEAQALVSAGEAVGGTMMYSLEENGDYSETIPTGTDANTYTVWYYVKGDGINYSDSDKASVDVTIEKATASVQNAPTANELTYNGEAQALITEGTANGGTLKYCLEENGTYSEAIPTGTDANTYTVWYYVKGDGINYSDSDTASVEVIIAKAIPTIEAPTASGIDYGQKLASSVLSDGRAWVDDTIVPELGTESYEAVLEVDDENYDYSDVDGYDAETHTVTRSVSVTVAKTTSNPAFFVGHISGAPGETVTLEVKVDSISGA